MAQLANSIPRLSIPRREVRVPAIGLTPLEAFSAEKGLGVRATRKFLLFVERAGGSLYTDSVTLSFLFGIWEEKGRP